MDLSGIRPLKVVVDAGNGMAGLTTPAVLGDALLDPLPLEIVPLYFELDGTFPNHPANPLEPAHQVRLCDPAATHSLIPQHSRPPALTTLLQTPPQPQSCRTSTLSPVSSNAPLICRLAHAYLIHTEQFTEYYYKTFDADRSQLAPLYVRH